MPSALDRVDGENTRFCPGCCAHQARSTSSPKAVSAAPSGRGYAAGSVTATPLVTATAGTAGVTLATVPHPARAAARPVAVSTARVSPVRVCTARAVLLRSPMPL